MKIGHVRDGMCCRVYGGWLKCGQVGEEWMGRWGLRRGR